MAGATTSMSIRMDRVVKEQAQQLFKSLGMDMTTAINIFLRQALIRKGLPFEVKQQPSKEFMEALNELDYMEKHPEDYKVYHNVDKMFEDILSED